MDEIKICFLHGSKWILYSYDYVYNKQVIHIGNKTIFLHRKSGCCLSYDGIWYLKQNDPDLLVDKQKHKRFFLKEPYTPLYILTFSDALYFFLHPKLIGKNNKQKNYKQYDYIYLLYRLKDGIKYFYKVYDKHTSLKLSDDDSVYHYLYKKNNLKSFQLSFMMCDKKYFETNKKYFLSI